ncbi:MAG: GNAT family N-acetyltransferase [Deltaproteobacteria bacterium]|nr:GNAT family N-acetyltransferase [Deltaproteobacteria bacterium]
MRFHRALYQGHRDEVVSKEDLPLIDYQDYERILRDDLHALMRDRDSHVLVAESQGVAVGYITGRVTVESKRVLSRRGVVEDWYVAPESRGSGVGALLLREIEERFAAVGCEMIESATWSGNEGARRAHDALGFREIRVMYRKRI